MDFARYGFSLTTFSPSGRLIQLEYAKNGVNQSTLSIGFKAKNAVVICRPKDLNPVLCDTNSIHVVEPITNNMGITYSGLGPDFRVLTTKARELAYRYITIHRKPMSPKELAQELGQVLQEYTHTGGVRCFGVTLTLCGWENNTAYLYECDLAGQSYPWKVVANGTNSVNTKMMLNESYNENMELDDIIYVVIRALKANYHGRLEPDSIEVGICNQNGFKRLTSNQIQDYLINIY